MTKLLLKLRNISIFSNQLLKFISKPRISNSFLKITPEICLDFSNSFSNLKFIFKPEIHFHFLNSFLQSIAQIDLKTVMPVWGNLLSKIENKYKDFCLSPGVFNKYETLCTNFSIILSSLFTGSVEKLFSISKHGSVGKVVWSTDNSILPGIGSDFWKRRILPILVAIYDFSSVCPSVCGWVNIALVVATLLRDWDRWPAISAFQ